MPTAASSWQIICRGLAVDVDFPVRGYVETGWRFHGRPRVRTAVIVNHWTAAENPPAAVYTNMLNHAVYEDERKVSQPLSVHFVVDKDGVVFQMADTEMRAAHCKAGGLNAASIGIEFIGRGTSVDLPSRGVERPLVTESLQGRRIRYYELTPAQVKVGVKLNRELCRLYGLPLRVPLDKAGQPHLYALSEDVLRTYTGCIAHGHAEARKNDCGLALLRALHQASINVS